GGVEVRAYHMGTGHTNGDAVIYFPDLRTVHGGDLLHGVAPFIDYANGGSSKGWVATVNNILALPFDTAIPGHGAIMSRADVTAFRNQMEAVRERMAALIRRGGLRRDVASEFVTPELSWTTIATGLFMQRSVSGLYDEIWEEVRE
ncbi:MAG TPA: MBL fold metallo-hydrolase, partial [Longimicrobiales bacterium]|nr:MBL fold metallo-hydrolase [Longimicrobiales bacterium]